MYLDSATVDFVSNMHGDRFVIDNPSASTTCGCGSSFSI
jgi:iron-sulfur cluster insertion protein